MKRFTPEQIVSKLRPADVEVGKGQTEADVLEPAAPRRGKGLRVPEGQDAGKVASIERDDVLACSLKTDPS